MSRLLIDEPPLQVLPSLAVLIGLNEAIALQQLHYWLINKKGERTAHYIEGRWWVYNSYDGWKGDFPFWSATTIKRAFLSLEKRRLVTSRQFEQREHEIRKWYTINYDELERLSRGKDQIRPNWPDALDQSGPLDQANPAPSIGPDRLDGSDQNEPILMYETTSETTPENTHTGQMKQPPWGTGVWSKHSLETCRKYAQWLHDTKQGIANPEGFAKACYRSGLDDDMIDRFLRDEAAVEAARAIIGAGGAAAGNVHHLVACNECGKMVAGPCSADWIECPLAKPPEEFADATNQTAS